jgi:hypothetical protein
MSSQDWDGKNTSCHFERHQTVQFSIWIVFQENEDNVYLHFSYYLPRISGYAATWISTAISILVSSQRIIQARQEMQ